MQNEYENNDICKRCGECCRKGGPALHKEDMPLIEDGTIELANIVTLRPGERAYDQIAMSVRPLEAEILKIKGRDGRWTCHFYSPEGCSCGIYESRPVECEKLFCGDIGPLRDIYNQDRLTRHDLLPEGHPLLELVEEHDAKCPPIGMEEIAKKAREGDAEAGRELKEMVTYDMEIRRLVVEKAGISQEMTEFLFGRPLKTLLLTMNIKVYEMGDSIRFSFAQGE
ncbi:YkgJ family cysteine cluster protein [Pseudodesulfovibrio sp. zrk46]|uniref:YkgJ family cysteine cluster protein n=1 Tax=Pseudodesulfovibrio sp. zrk46 TaxID=2725288 RepID=UPI001FFC3320|nr:YkgJ family cysteine cluster protein [Pseudodesulfovibrio sp. zrk46]